MQSGNDPTELINFDSHLLLQHDSEDAVREIIESIITSGANILHTHYLQMQINPYTTKTIGLELIMNSTWANFPLGSQPNISDTIPDDDLELPKVDSWANGALLVFESMPLRVSHTQECPVKKMSIKEKKGNKGNKRNDQITHQNSFKHSTNKENDELMLSPKKSLKQTRIFSKKTLVPSKQNSGTLTMNKIFEETKKSAGKNITIDSDLNIIEIVEHKNFATSLIVPKVATKRFQKDESPTKALNPKRRIPIQRRETKLKKKPLPKLLQVDTPSFADDQQTLSVAEKFVCSPGVTLKEGNFVKSKPKQLKPNELSRSEYQEYLKEFKKNSKNDFIE